MMTRLRVQAVFVAAAVAALLSSGAARADFIVNVDATLYGFKYPATGVSDPAPNPGDVITPISLAPGGALNQLTLPAGTYTIRNATGMAGANPNFTGWRFNAADNWVWSIVLADDATDKVIFYADRGGVQSSQAAIAADPTVQNFSGTFTLPATTKVDFMIRDYFLPDNAGGVAVVIPAAAVPEPGGVVLFVIGGAFAGLGVWLRRTP
jgi:hypothetical protein